jgi:hypothetical protein
MPPRFGGQARLEESVKRECVPGTVRRSVIDNVVGRTRAKTSACLAPPDARANASDGLDFAIHPKTNYL